jgi:hypothetical protein
MMEMEEIRETAELATQGVCLTSDKRLAYQVTSLQDAFFTPIKPLTKFGYAGRILAR